MFGTVWVDYLVLYAGGYTTAIWAPLRIVSTTTFAVTSLHLIYFLSLKLLYPINNFPMAQLQKIAPGPAGTSCLTCKQRSGSESAISLCEAKNLFAFNRHKKCDLRRPVCERCEKGGYNCLGYSHNKQNGVPSRPLSSSRQRSSPSTKDRTNVTVLRHKVCCLAAMIII